MLNYWPTRDMDAYLRLKSRVQARMALADVAASGSEDPFTEDDAQLELDFRDRQLLKLREEVLDLDDPNDAPAMSDFTLDYFFTQLLRYLEKNRDEADFLVQFPAEHPDTQSEQAFRHNVKSAHLLFQLTDAEIDTSAQGTRHGLLAYITSNSWLKAEYGRTTRRYFAERHTPLRPVGDGQGYF